MNPTALTGGADMTGYNLTPAAELEVLDRVVPGAARMVIISDLEERHHCRRVELLETYFWGGRSLIGLLVAGLFVFACLASSAVLIYLGFGSVVGCLLGTPVVGIAGLFLFPQIRRRLPFLSKSNDRTE